MIRFIPWTDSKNRRRDCVNCEAGQYRTSKKDGRITDPTKCLNCPTGWNSLKGLSKCQECGAGTYGSNGNGCLPCPLETARNSSDPDLTQCRQCKLGETTTIEGAVVCDKW